MPENENQNQNQSQKQDQNEEILSRLPSQFSKKFQAILYSEPKHIAAVGFYLIFITAIVLGSWAFFSIVNKSYLLRGEIIHLNPDISIQLSSPFEFKRHLLHIGQNIKKGDILFEYLDSNRNLLPYHSPFNGRVSQKIDLKRGVVYPANAEIINLKPDDKEVAVRLSVPDNILNKIKINNRVVYHFNFSFGGKNQIIEGVVLTEPVQDKEQYVVEANIDAKSMKILEDNKITLINGLLVTAEIVTGQERLLERFLGVKL